MAVAVQRTHPNSRVFPEAFDRFVDHFRTKVFQYSLMMCGQREDAEEVVVVFDTQLSRLSHCGRVNAVRGTRRHNVAAADRSTGTR